MTSANPNPGNFSNRPEEEVKNFASKSSHSGGFADMNPQRQRDIASQGGKASTGSFQPGEERAREAGRKGGSLTGSGDDDDDDDEQY